MGMVAYMKRLYIDIRGIGHRFCLLIDLSVVVEVERETQSEREGEGGRGRERECCAILPRHCFCMKMAAVIVS